MSTDYQYVIEGASGGFSSEINGYRFIVTIKLDGVLGDTDVAQMFNSINDPGVPVIGYDLGNEILGLEGCWLRDIACKPIGNGQSRMTLTFQQSPFNTVRISTQTQVSQLEATKDKDGNEIQVRYLYPTTYGGSEPTQREEDLRGEYSDLQGGTINLLVPESTRTYTLRQAVDGDLIARSYIGTVNDATWQDGVAGSIGFLFMNQGLIMRFMACKNVNEGRKAAAINILFVKDFQPV